MDPSDESFPDPQGANPTQDPHQQSLKEKLLQRKSNKDSQDPTNNDVDSDPTTSLKPPGSPPSRDILERLNKPYHERERDHSHRNGNGRERERSSRWDDRGRASDWNGDRDRDRDRNRDGNARDNGYGNRYPNGHHNGRDERDSLSSNHHSSSNGRPQFQDYSRPPPPTRDGQRQNYNQYNQYQSNGDVVRRDEEGPPPPGAWGRRGGNQDGQNQDSSHGQERRIPLANVSSDSSFFAARDAQRKNSTVTIWPRSPERSWEESEEERERKERKDRKSKSKSKSKSKNKSSSGRKDRDRDRDGKSKSRKHHSSSRRSSEKRKRYDSDEDSQSDEDDDDSQDSYDDRKSRKSKSKSRRHDKSSSSKSKDKKRSRKSYDSETDSFSESDSESDSKRKRARSRSESESNHRHRSKGKSRDRSVTPTSTSLSKIPQGEDPKAVEEKGSESDSSSTSQIGPSLPKAIQIQEKSRHNPYGQALLAGEGEAMAQFASEGQRIPRRGEIGLDSEQIEKYENAGFVMSGSRHRRMNAVRIRKENQIISAEEKRGILKLQAEEREKREREIVGQFKELLDDLPDNRR